MANYRSRKSTIVEIRSGAVSSNDKHAGWILIRRSDHMSSLPSAIKFVETACSRSDAEKCITETSAALLGHPQGVLHLVSLAPNIICEAGSCVCSPGHTRCCR